MMFCGRRQPTQAEAVLVWELASTARLRRLVFVRLGALAPCTAAVMAAFLAVPRTLVRLALSGTALSEHLVVRVKNGVNAECNEAEGQ